MSASLVGSEMCIRDRSCVSGAERTAQGSGPSARGASAPRRYACRCTNPCLLYTSDAADDM
eukprot:12099478-Alexandrium_andersonii.AAC.1